ncbi:hypothetical protein DOY81_001884 [Sarcophaga bullata]|nr:hypothetical protein DOY81_001884 [Sarcophaga bullata]
MQDGRQAAQQCHEEEAGMELNSKPQPPQRFNLSHSLHSRPSTEDDETEPEARYECAICMNWLKEPVLTACGHRFCNSCLDAWLRNKGQFCPFCNNKLIYEKDIFPDKFTKREIGQIKLKCNNSKLGCDFVSSPLDMEHHRYVCRYRSEEKQAEEKCPFASIKCDFVGRPETNALEMHLKEDMPHHLQLMLRAMQNTAINSWNPQKTPRGQAQTNGHNGKEASNGAGGALPPPPQYANGGEEQLIEAMCQRIVVLEQRTREQDVKIENLTKQLASTRSQLEVHNSHGTIVWEIKDFHNLVEYLRLDVNNLVYSHECYTSPYGYKFCARLNIQPKNLNVLKLHVHLMQSENDIHLKWPFNGRIQFCMFKIHIEAV